ncbi:MAG: hypothetical protein P8Z37_01290 [Acidobacteriota bacterium]
MYENKKKIALSGVIIAIAFFMILVQLGATGIQAESYKLEGAWISRTTLVELPGISEIPFQWSYVLAPSPSGNSASIHGSVDVAFPPAMDYDFLTPLIGEAVKTGPDTASFDSIWYAIRKGDPVDGIVFIGRSWGEVRSVEPGKSETTHHFEIYLPDTAQDWDGIPNGEPIFTFTAYTQDTRLPGPGL